MLLTNVIFRFFEKIFSYQLVYFLFSFVIYNCMTDKVQILFRKFINKTSTKQEFDELMQLLQQCENEPLIREMLKEVYCAGEQSLLSETYIAADGGLHKDHVLEPERKGGRQRLLLMTSIAACLLLAASIGFLWKMYGPEKVIATSIVTAAAQKQISGQNEISQQTGRAEQKHLILPDGTQVWLNAESTLEIPEKFDKDKRVVFLSGEGFFDVKHADKWPFIIQTPNNVSTRVLGTAFDVKAYKGQSLSVSVKRGRVRVSKNNQVLAILTVGQQIKVASLPGIKPLVQTIKKENIASWTEGKLSYDGMALEDILKDLERVYNVHIRLGSTIQGKEVITTTFNQSDGVEIVLKTLCLLTNTTYTVQDNNYIIH